MENWKAQLNEWKNELLRPKSNDLLIHIPEDSKKVYPINSDENRLTFELDANAQINTVLKEQNKYKKHFGVNALCTTFLTLKWKLSDKQLLSPLYLVPTQVKFEKIHQKIHFSLTEDKIINPFLDKLIQTKFNYSLSELIATKNLPEGWEIQSQSFLGNFHYHRHTILKDIDFYIENKNSIDSNLGAFFRGTPLEGIGRTCNNNHQIFPWDTDQKEIVDFLAKGENAKVSGPPGTGKSQLIANVVFQHALAEKWVLVSSEKEAAMQVVLDKMKARGLQNACLFVGNVLHDKTAVVRSLQSAWEHLDYFPQSKKQEIETSTYRQRVEAFERKIERLKQIPKTTNCSLKNNFSHENAPDLADWEKAKLDFERLNTLYQDWKNTSITKSSFGKLKSSLLYSKNTLLQLDKELKHIVNLFTDINQKLPKNIHLKTFEDLKKFNRLTIHAQILQQDLFLQHSSIFEHNSKDNKEFVRRSAKWLELNEQIQSYDDKISDSMTVEEWKAMLEVLIHSNKWGRIYRINKKQFRKLFNTALFSKEIAKTKITQQIELLRLIQKRSKLKQDLFLLGLRNPETDITLVDTLLLKVKKLDQGLLKTLQEKPTEQLKTFANLNAILGQITHFLINNFELSDEAIVMQAITQIQTDLPFFIAHHQLLSKLSREHIAVFSFVQNVEEWSQIESIIALENLKKFQVLQPDLFNYSGIDFAKEIDSIQLSSNSFFEEEAKLLFAQQAEKFRKFHRLLETPARKLSEDEKQLKTELRKGRNLLIKEFGKQKQHLSIHELLSTEARHWLKILKPIWMISPLQITEVLPNQKAFIDLLIVDEASQIPFVHALPAIYRSKQICMVGDEMQMSPTSFFTPGSSEKEDVLSRFGYHSQSFVLHYHYRSLHPRLIAFSNRFFYEGALNVFSQAYSKENQGIFFHQVKNAVYFNRENTAEATQLLEWLNNKVNEFEHQDTFMIATFSEQQQNCIVNLLEKKYSKLKQHCENEKIIFKTVEHIQGDECEHLVISFGYGKNEKGDFLHQFGPINQAGGDKRLNVLFSRARKSIHLFSSVKTSDFKLSNNRGVDLLRQFHAMAENKISLNDTQVTILDKWSLNYLVNDNKINISNFNHNDLNGLQIMTLKNILNQRGWKVTFTFDKDRFLGKI